MDELDPVYEDSTPFITVKFGTAEIKRGRTSLADEKCLRRQKTASTDDNIVQVHQMLVKNRRIKVREVAEAMRMPKERVCHVLNQDLGMRKLSVR